MELLVIPMLWLLFATFSAVIASSKNRSGFGWFLIGLLFGPFGLLVAALPAVRAGAGQAGSFAHEYEPTPNVPPALNRKCPFCAEIIKAEAVVCRFCGRDLPVLQATDSEFLQLAFRGDTQAVALCLERGADVDARNSNGATALFLAAVQNRPELATLLLERGANPTIPNNAGKTPREAAAEQGHREILALL